MPVKGMRIGIYGWEGSYARKGTWTADDGTAQNGVRSLDQHRDAISGEYVVDDWTFRSEYIHSTGKAFAKALVNTNDATSTNCELSSNGDKSRFLWTGDCPYHQEEDTR